MRRGRWCRVTLFLFCANPFWVKTGFHFCAGFVEGLGFGYAVGLAAGRHDFFAAISSKSDTGQSLF